MRRLWWREEWSRLLYVRQLSRSVDSGGRGGYKEGLQIDSIETDEDNDKAREWLNEFKQHSREEVIPRGKRVEKFEFP